jgi:hypothetical protein
MARAHCDFCHCNTENTYNGTYSPIVRTITIKVEILDEL